MSTVSGTSFIDLAQLLTGESDLCKSSSSYGSGSAYWAFKLILFVFALSLFSLSSWASLISGTSFMTSNLKWAFLADCSQS